MNRWAAFGTSLLLASTVVLAYEKSDRPEGWASQSGGTTGGIGGTEVTVSNIAQLQTEARSLGKKIILVNKGIYTGQVILASDKSILGKEPGVVIKGTIKISKVSNVIIRNLAVQGDRCNTYDECKGGADGIGTTESHHIWLDHLDVSDGQDGNCDITNGSDFVTVTWSKFSYSYDKEHRFSNLIAADDNLTIDQGKLNITYAYCWWADRVVERQPRGRAGKVHVVNNLYTSSATNYVCGPGVDIQMLIENNNMKTTGTAIKPFDGSPAPAFKSVGNIGTAKNISINQGTVFTPPYALSLKLAATDVEAQVKPVAGNTLTLGVGEVSGILASENKRQRLAPVLRKFGPGMPAFSPDILSSQEDFVDSRGRTLKVNRGL